MVRFTMLAVALLVLTGASNARGQDTDEVKKLKREVELLERELKVAKSENELLKTRIAELEKVAGKKDQPVPKADLFALETQWAGKATLKDKDQTKLTAKVTVTERTEKSAKLTINFENGVIQTFTCITDGKVLHITSAERVKAAEGADPKRLQPLGGTKGKGSVEGGKITFSYTTPAGFGLPESGATVVAERGK